ncbi:MAG: SDR family oxidoreductase, partial [Halobacteriovoraceae bacterium]|nr:SDR family oxidoreductase [Halobacteriovoraceae bacterium]
IYCAGISRSEADDSKSSELNIKMLQNLTNSLAGTKIQKITFLSSVEIYGNTPGLPLDENSPARPERKYAEAKLQQEELLRTFCQQQNCQLSLLRLPGVYGRSEKKLGFINQLTDRLQNGGNYQIYQGGGERRDFLHILDLVQVIFLLEDKEIPEQLLNIATGESYSTLQWKDWLCQKLAVSGSAIEILPATKELGHLEFDTSKLRELLPEFKFSLPQDVLGL